MVLALQRIAALSHSNIHQLALLWTQENGMNTMQVAILVVCFPHTELLHNLRKPRMDNISPVYLLNCVIQQILEEES